MTYKNTPSAKTLRIKVKDDKVTITFNAEGWNPAHGSMLDSLAAEAEIRNIPVAEYIGHAILLKGMDVEPTKERFDRWVQIHESLCELERSTQTPSHENDTDTLEL